MCVCARACVWVKVGSFMYQEIVIRFDEKENMGHGIGVIVMLFPLFVLLLLLLHD